MGILLVTVTALGILASDLPSLLQAGRDFMNVMRDILGDRGDIDIGEGGVTENIFEVHYIESPDRYSIGYTLEPSTGSVDMSEIIPSTGSD